jgi:hypothetical protein
MRELGEGGEVAEVDCSLQRHREHSAAEPQPGREFLSRSRLRRLIAIFCGIGVICGLPPVFGFYAKCGVMC